MNVSQSATKSIIVLGNKGGSSKTTTALLLILSAITAGKPISVLELESRAKITTRLDLVKDALAVPPVYFPTGEYDLAELEANPLRAITQWDAPLDAMRANSYVVDTGAHFDDSFLAVCRLGTVTEKFGNGDNLIFALPFDESDDALENQATLAAGLKKLLPGSIVYLIGVGVGKLSTQTAIELSEKLGTDYLALPLCENKHFRTLARYEGLLAVLSAATDDAALREEIRAKHGLTGSDGLAAFARIASWSKESFAALRPIIDRLGD